jgi:hypothetical protein
MAFQLPKQITQMLTVGAAAVILLLSVFAGAKTGERQAQSRAVLGNAKVLATGLRYFYSDNGRFPSAAEFQDNRNLMLDYFDSFPPQDLFSGQCPQNYSYQRPSAATFKLNFCLPAAIGQYQAGWNQLNENSQ